MNYKLGSLRQGITVEDAAMLILELDYDFIQYFKEHPPFPPNRATPLAPWENVTEDSDINKYAGFLEIVEAITQELDAKEDSGRETCLEFLSIILHDSHQNYRIDYDFSTITRASLKQWCHEHHIKTHAFDEPSLAGANCTDQQSTEEDNNLSHELCQIKKLLEGQHERQSPELVICLKAWLELSDKYKDTGLVSGVTSKVVQWLKLNEPQIESSKKIDRIKTVVNWNKKR